MSIDYIIYSVEDGRFVYVCYSLGKSFDLVEYLDLEVNKLTFLCVSLFVCRASPHDSGEVGRLQRSTLQQPTAEETLVEPFRNN